MSNVKFEHLFTPLQVGPMRAPNRICETTNTINSSMTPGRLDEHFIAHHGAKARVAPAGSAAKPGCSTHPFHLKHPMKSACQWLCLTLWRLSGPSLCRDMTKFCAEIHAAGSVAIVQLTHLNSVWAPSPVPVVGVQAYTHRMCWARRKSNTV